MTAISLSNPEKKLTQLRWQVFAFGLVISLLMVFVGWRAQHFVNNRPDPYHFAAMAHDLLHRGGFDPAEGSVLNRRAPLYPATIAFFYLIFGEHPIIIQIVQSFLLAGMCLLAFDIGRRLYNLRTGLIAAALCALNPMLLRYVPDFHLEVLLTFLFTLTIWATVRCYERPTLLNGLLVGVLGGLASLTKPVVVIYPVLFGAYLVFLRLQARRRGGTEPVPWPALAALVLGMAVIILPWTIRNYRATGGHFVLITTGLGDAFLRGYVFSRPEYALQRLPPYTYAENESNALFMAICQQNGTVWQRNDLETDRILGRAAKQKLLSDPAAFVRKFVIGLFTFWCEMTSKVNSLVAAVLAMLGWTLTLIGWRRSRREGRPAWLLLLPILYLNLSLAALLALGRYSVPLIPIFMVLAAFGLDTLLQRRASAST